MKRFLLILFAALPMAAMAQHELKSDETQTQQTVELRQEVCLSYDLPHNLDLSLDEELRSCVYDRTYNATGALTENAGARFSKSYTTLELGYRPIRYQSLNTGYKYGLKFALGYTLRLLADKDMSDPKECLQHRPHLSATGSVDFGPVKLSLRERYLVDIRLDSCSIIDRFTDVNGDGVINDNDVIYEKNPYAMELRSRLRLDFSIPGKPVKPYTYVELTNTLNEPTCPWTDDDGLPLYGGQYINSIRACAAIKWRISRHSALTIAYTFYWINDRDINFTRSMQNVEITRTTGYRHCITLAYDLGY